jgi:hypothetical protein
MPCSTRHWSHFFSAIYKEKVSMLNGLKGRKIHTRNIQISTYDTDVQGFWVHRAKELKSDESTPDLMNSYVIDTCWVWRKDSPLAIQKMEAAKR